MTMEEIEERVEKIKLEWDDTFQHSAEDELYHDFVRYVAETGDEELRKKALAVLKTEEINFARWYG